MAPAASPPSIRFLPSPGPAAALTGLVADSAGPVPAQESRPADPSGAVAPTDDTAAPPSHMKLTGRIWRARSGFAFARTPVGMLTLFSKEGLRQVKAGQWATVWTHGRNIVVDIFNKGEPTPRHRFITAVPVSGLWIAGSDHPDALDARGRHAR